MIAIAFIAACAPGVAPSTMQEIIAKESSGDVLAMNANRGRGVAVRLRSRTLDDAVRLAMAEIAAGNSVDIGLTQINSRNLQALGITVRDAFEPCTNLRGGSRILRENYQRAVRRYGPGQRALQAALSAYNTGDMTRGFANGYVSRYYDAPQRSRGYSYPSAAVLAAPTVVYERVRHMNAITNTVQQQPIISRDYSDLLTPGVQVELDAGDAEALGIIVDDAMSERDAWESNGDAASAPFMGASVDG